jgi:hypothetical protein
MGLSCSCSYSHVSTSSVSVYFVLCTLTESLFSGLSLSVFPCLRTSKEDDRFEAVGCRRLPNMTLYLSNLMSGMLTSKSGIPSPDKIGTCCALCDANSLGTAGKSFPIMLDGTGVVAERTTDTRGLAGRLFAVNARGRVCGGEGAILGAVNVRDARMFGLNVGGDGVRPVCRSSIGSAYCLAGLGGSSS